MENTNSKLEVKVKTKSEESKKNFKSKNKSPINSPIQKVNRLEKQTFLPSKLTLTINFGTTENPKSRSRAKRPKSATPTSSPRIGSARKILETPRNDAYVKYDDNQYDYVSLSSTLEGSLRRNSDSLNGSLKRNKSNLDSNKTDQDFKRRHSTTEVGNVTIATHQLAEALFEVQRSRPSSAKPTPKKNPSGAWQSNRSSLRYHSTLASSDIHDVNFKYTFLNRPVSEMSPRFRKTMNRYKEDYNFLKSRIGEDNNLVSTQNITNPDNLENTSEQNNKEINDNSNVESINNHEDNSQSSYETNLIQDTKTFTKFNDTNFSYSMQSFPAPRFILTKKETEEKINQRPRSASNVKRRNSIKSQNSSKRSSSQLSFRPSSATPNFTSYRYTPNYKEPENISEIFFSGFPPSKGVSKQFLQNQKRLSIGKNEKLRQLLSTPEPLDSQIINSTQENKLESDSIRKENMNTEKIDDQQDILDFYEKSNIEVEQKDIGNTSPSTILPASVRAKLDEEVNPTNDESASDINNDIQKSTPKSKISTLQIQTLKNKNQSARNVLSPSPVSPVLFNDFSNHSLPMGNIYDPAIYSPTGLKSPVNGSKSPISKLSGALNTILEDSQLTQGLSISEKIKLFDSLPSSPISKQPLSIFSGTIDISKSPSIKQRPRTRNSLSEKTPLSNDTPTSPVQFGSPFEYKQKNPDLTFPSFQITKKEFTSKPMSPIELSSTSPISYQQETLQLSKKLKSNQRSKSIQKTKLKRNTKKKTIRIKTPSYNHNEEKVEGNDTPIISQEKNFED